MQGVTIKKNRKNFGKLKTKFWGRDF